MKQFFAILFASLMLISSLDIGITSHFCGGKAVKSAISFNRDKLSCGMITTDLSCIIASNTSSLKNKKCCENRFSKITIDNNFKNIQLKIFSSSLLSLAVQPYQLEFFCIKYTVVTNPQYYSPPKITFDIPVLIQSFLI